MRRTLFTALSFSVLSMLAPATLVADEDAPDDGGRAPFIRVRNETTERWVPVNAAGEHLASDPIENGGAIPLGPLVPGWYRAEPSGVQLGFAPAENLPGVLVVRIAEPSALPAAREYSIPLSVNAPNVLTLGAGFAPAIRPGIPTAITLADTEIDAGATVAGEISVNATDSPVTVQVRAKPSGVVKSVEAVTAVGGIARFSLEASRPAADRRVTMYAKAGGTEKSIGLLVRRQPWRLVAVTTRRHRATGGAEMVGTVHVTAMTEDSEPVILALESSSPLVRVPAEVEVHWAERLSRADFRVETEPVATPTAVRITASGASGERGWTVRLEPLLPAALVLDPPAPPLGATAIASVTLSDQAPTDTEILVRGGPEGTWTLPGRVPVKKGQRIVSFEVRRSTSGADDAWLSVALGDFPGLELRESLNTPGPGH
jgi:hypothetical protein